MIGGYSSRFYDGPESPQQIGATFLEQLTADMLVSLTNAGADATFTNLAVLGTFLGSEAGGPFLPLAGGVITGDLTVDGITTLENASPSSVTATNSTTPRTLANRFADVANVLDYGADPTGVADSTAAINLAASTTVNGLYRDVWLPSGNYVVTNELAIGNGQTLFGDGRGLTNLMVTTTLSSSARGIVVMSGREQFAPTVCALSITFVQPPDTVTTTTAPTTAGNNTITVASVLNILVGGSVTDATASAAIPNFTTVVSVVGNVVTLSANIAAPGVGSGDNIHFNTSRALFQTLAGGATVGAGGTGCKYPPAIYSANANRFKIYDVLIQGAWDGINAGAASTIGGFFIENIECGALNTGLFLDQSFDFGHVAHYHFWNFGMGGNIFSQVFADGQTKAADLGAVEGLGIDDFTTFLGYLNFNSAASAGWFHIGNLQLDQAQLNVDGAMWCLIDNLECLRGTPATAVQNNINVSGGNVQIDNIYMTTNVLFPVISVTGGALAIYGGTIGNQNESPFSITVSGGILELDNIRFGTHAGSLPLIRQSGSDGVLIVQNCQFPTNTTRVAIQIDTDNENHSIQSNNFNGWTFTPPGALGSYANVLNSGHGALAFQSTGLSAIVPASDLNGAIVSLFGNGTTTPNKFIRAGGGNLQVISSDFSTALLTLTDAGSLSVPLGGMTVGSSVLATAVQITVASTTGHQRGLLFTTGSLNRWALLCLSGAESGGNAGSDLALTCFSDAGAQIFIPISATRATGTLLLGGNSISDVIVGRGSVGTTTDTGGHLCIPFCAGAPTGIPADASAGIALRYDTTNHKLWAYDTPSAAWKGVVLT